MQAVIPKSLNSRPCCTYSGVPDGDKAFLKQAAEIATTTGSLIAARGGIGQCHAALAETKQTIPGLRAVAIGDEECPPKTGFADLRIVA